MKELDEQEIQSALLQGSRAYYEALRGPNGRFRYLKISDILFTGTETSWLETCVELDEKSHDLFEKRSRHPQKLLTNQKFYRDPGDGFSKESPGRRSHSIIEVLPHPVRLKELEDGQVETYLQEHGMTGTGESGKGGLENRY